MKPLLYVDGYNIIGAWPQAQREGWPLDECRDRLIHLLQDYAGYTGQEVWLVFDGYKAERPLRSVEERDGLTVVYTRHGETADHYIERMCQLLPRYREARVATSDYTEQTLILGRGDCGESWPPSVPTDGTGIRCPARSGARRFLRRLPRNSMPHWTGSEGKNKGR